LEEVEKELEGMVDGLVSDPSGEDSLVRLKQCEAKKLKLLMDKEVDWQIKS
jgi:hypothetical protein